MPTASRKYTNSLTQPPRDGGVSNTHTNPNAVVSKAVQRAADRLGLSAGALAMVLGVSGASISRLGSGARQIAAESKEGELALLFIRLFRSLDALMGGNDTACRTWLHSENRHLGGTPALLIKTVQGLVDTAEYLDAMRAKI